MERFITFRDKDHNGALLYYIADRQYPNLVAKVVYEPAPHYHCFPIEGYGLFVQFDGVISGRLLPVNVKKEIIQPTLVEMADWYLKNRILVKEGRYKRFAKKK